MTSWTMYRQRLKSLKGCLRCKRRHRKCDEIHPQCSFCMRHDLKCVWPTNPSSRQDAGRKPDTVLLKQPCKGQTERGGLSFDPFHNMHVRYLDRFGVITECLRDFFVDITQQTYPFDMTHTQHELSRGWFALMFEDEAVCSSFVTYCSLYYAERIVVQDGLAELCTVNERRSLSILRQRIESGHTATQGTLVAAALHFFIATFTVGDAAQLSRMARGVAALVASVGGLNSIWDSMSSSTIHSLVVVDVFNSLLSTQRPFLEYTRLLPRPESFDLLYTDSSIDSTIANCLEDGLLDIIQDLRFILFFRTPSQQSRDLHREESSYIYALLQKISYSLCIQQHRLVKTCSLSEMIVYALILVKEQILLDVTQHPIVPITILRRLRGVISVLGVQVSGPGVALSLWASTIALAGNDFLEDRVWAWEFVRKTLKNRYGTPWPQKWHAELCGEVQRILWHDRIQVAFDTMCDAISTMATQHPVDVVSIRTRDNTISQNPRT